MESLGQDRLRNLRVNYKRNKTIIIILTCVTLLLFLYAAFMAYKVYSIRASVIHENSHYITEAESEKNEADARRSAARKKVDAAKERNAAVIEEIESHKTGKQPEDP